MKKQLLFSLIISFNLYFGHCQFYEGFEGTNGPNALPSTIWNLASGNWYVFDNSVGLETRWNINNGVAVPPLVQSGANAAYINREEIGLGNTSEDYLATPVITFFPNGQLRFYSRTFTNGNQGTIYQIKVCSANSIPTNPLNYTTIAEFTEDQISSNYNIYEEKIIDIPASLIGTDGRIAFVRKNTQTTDVINGDRWLIDDVRIVENSSCIAPNLYSTVNNTTSVTAFWYENNSATSWEILVLPCESPVPNSTSSGSITNSNPYIITGLVPDTCYKIYVRSICSPTDFSEWSNSLDFISVPQPDCGGTFTDNGGTISNYTNNSNNNVTICPTIPGDVVNVTFTSFNVEANFDALYVFNGNSTSSAQISTGNPGVNVPSGLAGGFWGTTLPGPFTSSSADGCLTFRFRSNADITNSGWTANVNCGSPTLNSIQLRAFLDGNNNGLFDSGEIDFANGTFVYQINDSGVTNYVSPSTGSYNIVDFNTTNSYDFSYQINSEYTSYLSNSSTYNNISTTLGSGMQTLFFPTTIINPFNDLQISIIPTQQPRPGFSYSNLIKYKNIGTNAQSGTVTFVKDPEVAITSISQTGTTNNSSGFSYNFTNLLPFETRQINVIMSVPTIPTVNISDVLTNSATITSSIADNILGNNSFTNSQIVIGSYDPNDKMESHGGEIQFNQFVANDYLYYTVRFQNEGTAEAFTVRIEDLLDAQLDETSIRVLSASHLYSMNRVNNQITWTFNNINLVPTIVNEELSKGYVLFKIKLKPGFAVGDIIPNTGEIYFDFNPAIVTNTFNTEFVAALNNLDFSSGNFLIYPNPATDLVEVSLNTNSTNIESIVIFDVLGKIVKKVESVNSNQTYINVSEISSGVYMIEVTTDNNLKQIKKLIIK